MKLSSQETSDYRLDPEGHYLIRDYNRKRPFSNFLPGIAGLYGTPMWVFYVNRGQGIASFGTRNKDNAILEFSPANKAYQSVTSLGFRTFLKISRSSKTFFYEPFREGAASSAYLPEQTFEIRSPEFSIHETNRQMGLETRVRYFTVPNEPLAALAREVVFTNLSGAAFDLEFLDGLPSVNPYGMNEFFAKNMSRTIEAWMIAENVWKKAPFFRLKVDATDRPEIVFIRGGNFYFGVIEEAGGRTRLAEPIVDPEKIFGSRLDFGEPKLFYQNAPFRFPQGQVTESRTPCAFCLASMRLAPGKSAAFRSFFGHAENPELLNRYALRAKSRGYFEIKRDENRALIEGIKSRIFTVTDLAAYDFYCGQSYLDNVLRGGMPVPIGDGKRFVFYVYSRKHGDLERDYNRFLLEPTYFSQGDGNYRDVNQNRRNDVWFEPLVKDANIRKFLNLIQLDGFNPLVTKGAHFALKPSKASRGALAGFVSPKTAAASADFLREPFTLGEFYRFLEKCGPISGTNFKRLLAELAPFLSQEQRAEHGEGFWIDHWTYNLDLIESYLSIFPEDGRRLLFEDRRYVFFDNDHAVRPRDEKYCLKKPGVVRQYQAVVKDPKKELLFKTRTSDRHLVRTRHGRGGVYETTLFVKLLSLVANKLASLDAQGIGIEMEADKPSWYDALNGLPGLLGSSLPETFELKRLALFMTHALEDWEMDPATPFRLPSELHAFIRKLDVCLRQDLIAQNKPFLFWETASKAKEEYRRRVHWGLSGKEKAMALFEVKSFLEHAREKIDVGLEKAFDEKRKIFPTYFENVVVRHRRSGGAVRPTRFVQTALPLFLEGPVHALKVERDPLKRREIWKAVRSSELYDRKLGMYRVCESLADASLEIGRARVFSPGWLERESVWLHMEYKFMLEVLKGGMAEEFFEDFKRALIPFQNAERYGRSILENSSFIVSSAFVDKSLHGGGFVARLSGSTAEFLTMWLLMNVGKRPFLLGPGGKLSLRFQPTLPSFLFTQEETSRILSKDGKEEKVRVAKNSLAFLFLGKTLVTYHNPKRLDTFGKTRCSVKKVSLHLSPAKTIEFKGDTIPAPFAEKVRDAFVPRIDIELG